MQEAAPHDDDLAAAQAKVLKYIWQRNIPQH